MNRIVVVLLAIVLSVQLAGCTKEAPIETEGNIAATAAPSNSPANNQQNHKDEQDRRFSYLEQLPLAKQGAFVRFKADKSLIKELADFTPEEMVIAYLYCLSISDPYLIYAITYNGGKLPDQDTFHTEYSEYVGNKDSDTAVHYRYFDSIKVDPSTAEENKVTVVVTVGVGLVTHSLALGLQKEDGIWKMDIYHLIDHYKEQANEG